MVCAQQRELNNKIDCICYQPFSEIYGLRYRKKNTYYKWFLSLLKLELHILNHGSIWCPVSA